MSECLVEEESVETRDGYEVLGGVEAAAVDLLVERVVVSQHFEVLLRNAMDYVLLFEIQLVLQVGVLFGVDHVECVVEVAGQDHVAFGTTGNRELLEDLFISI